jgi:hypothetical protein
MTRHVELAPHEFAANFLFTDDDLDPYFGADYIIKQSDGSRSREFQHDGERWVVKLYYQDSNIVHPGEQNPQGTEFEIEEMREFRLAVARHPDEDDVGEQDFNAHLSPRWQGMEMENKHGEISEYNVPDGIHEGVNVKIKGSNIQFARYHDLLQSAARAVDLNPRYFEDFHDYSNVQDAERYVRLHKERSGPVHARDGPITQIAHLLQNDREGYRKLVQNDSDEHGRNLPGYYHTATLDPRRIREAFPNHRLPKEIKHYYAREALSKPDDHPLRHPKLGASYQVSRWDETYDLDPQSLADLEKELDETVLSTLAEAGIPICPPDDTNGPFVPDAYWTPEAVETDRNVIDLNLTEIQSTQKSVVLKHVADGLSPVEWESLETLVTDGGTVSPADIAQENDRHVDTVRRALKRLPELIEHDYGEVKLRSDHIAEHVHEAVEQARNATRRAVEATAKAKEAAERGVDESSSALMAFCAKHGIDTDDSHEARMRLRMHGVSNVSARLKEAYRLWVDSGRDPQRFREAQVDLGERGFSDAWRFL